MAETKPMEYFDSGKILMHGDYLERMKEIEDYELNDRMKVVSDNSKTLISYAQKIIEEMVLEGE